MILGAHHLGAGQSIILQSAQRTGDGGPIGRSGLGGGVQQQLGDDMRPGDGVIRVLTVLRLRALDQRPVLRGIDGVPVLRAEIGPLAGVGAQRLEQLQPLFLKDVLRCAQ